MLLLIVFFLDVFVPGIETIVIVLAPAIRRNLAQVFGFLGQFFLGWLVFENEIVFLAYTVMAVEGPVYNVGCRQAVGVVGYGAPEGCL